MAGLFGVSPTIKVAGVFFGTDKIGHFFSQGRKFYGRYRRLRDESKAARQAIFTENWLFGRLTTGIYSNADLVANYEGYRFYREFVPRRRGDGSPRVVPLGGRHAGAATRLHLG